MMRMKKIILAAVVVLVPLVSTLFIIRILSADVVDTNLFIDTSQWQCEGDGTLLTASDAVYCLHRHNIFFIETSKSKLLNPRQACAIESAARHNPSYDVKILLTPTEPIDLENPLIKKVTNISNVQVLRIDVGDVVYGSPIWNWYTSNVWSGSTHQVCHLSDALRLLLVWKYGGMYLDSDIVVLRSLEELSNSTISDNGVNSANGILIFDKGHPFLKKCMINFAKKYDRRQFAENGPLLITRNMKEFCNVSDLREIHKSSCNISVLPMETAFPIPYEQWEEYFNPPTNITASFNSSYLIHVWNRLSKKGTLTMGRNSLYELAMKDNCPTVHEYALQLGFA